MKRPHKIKNRSKLLKYRYQILLLCGVFILSALIPFTRNRLAHIFIPSAFSQVEDPVIVGAGDIATCGSNNDEATASLLDAINGTVITLGDDAYPDGTPTDFTNCYDPAWGRHKARTRPVPGNHDYHTTGGAGYYGYFGAAATPDDPTCTNGCAGYYSYTVGNWHIVALNGEIAHDAASPQVQWLDADLAANPTDCTLAYWHEPRFSSGANHGSNAGYQPFWDVLYRYQADVVLNGHDHEYERFGPQSPTGQADANGIREFVAGTGGAGLYTFGTILPNSEVRDSGSHGVIKLTLHPQSYDWEFVPVTGDPFTDSGNASCVGLRTPTPTTDPNATPTPTPVPTVTVSSQIAGGTDDAEERLSGSMYITSSDLEFVTDGTNTQTVGMRFTGLQIPRSAAVSDAYIEFTANEQQTDVTDLRFYGQAADNPPTFSGTSGDITHRLKTSNVISWNTIPVWTIKLRYRTPDLSPVVQELINRPGWTSGNAMVFIADGSGHRTAYAYEGNAGYAAKLVVTYVAGGGTVTPTPSAAPIETPTPTTASVPTPTPTPTPVADQIVIPVADDASVRQGQPTTNVGLATRLEIDNGPVKHILLKFAVAGIGTRTIQNAKIRVYNTDKSDKGGDIYVAASNIWSENTVTWNTAPAATGTKLSSLASVNGTGTNPKPYDLDVTGAISGDGTYSFRITTLSTNGADYVSKQGNASQAPRLIITTLP